LGSSSLLEVPVTIRPSRWQRVLGRRAEPRWLRPTRTPATELVRIARDELIAHAQSRSDKPCILNVMFHNVEILPRTSPYASNQDEANGILRRLFHLLEFAEKLAIPVVGLADVKAALC
jgi:hypothetical protein